MPIPSGNLDAFFDLLYRIPTFFSTYSGWSPKHDLAPLQPDQEQRRPWTAPDGKHAFRAPGAGDVRSPCPALNTLANHGYIDRSGKKISASSLTSSLTSVYHLSHPLAGSLVAGGFLCCGNMLEGLSLDALAAHNKIEHDASLVHDNAPPGAKFAPCEVDLTLLHELIKRYPDGLGLDQLAEARALREEALNKEGRKKLNEFHEEIGRGEAALTWLLMKDDTDVVNTRTLEQWYGEETFPDTYSIPEEEISLEKAKAVSAEIKSAMRKETCQC
jgi:hypothetical protein